MVAPLVGRECRGASMAEARARPHIVGQRGRSVGGNESQRVALATGNGVGSGPVNAGASVGPARRGRPAAELPIVVVELAAERAVAAAPEVRGSGGGGDIGEVLLLRVSGVG
jgi:hypothetical protein